jgi:hypothetical protein
MNNACHSCDSTIRRIYPWFIILAIVSTVACHQSVVFIGLPQDRYDHNRTIEISIVAKALAAKPFLLANEYYGPRSSDIFPTVSLKELGPAYDGLPDAVMIPVFTGLLLPLDSRPGGRQAGDRRDLLEYLAAGIMAGTGVEAAGVSGDVIQAEREFQSLLSFFESADALKGSRADILKRLSAAKIKGCPATIKDSRFNSKSFEDTFAVRFRQFWFILFKIPGQASYSRLVVVPDVER